MPKKYVAVGTGGRIPMFIDPIASTYRDDAVIVGFCDISPIRMNFHRQRLIKEYGIPDFPLFEAKDFDRMLAEQKPDTVIVCTIDSLHHEYIIRSLEGGCDVVCEKPITTDEEKCRAILDAVNRTGKSVRVTFNVRWSPGVTKVKDMILNGAIGNIQHVGLDYMLDTSHGADYFRRWHSDMASSGGLLVHKSTHHFDLVNWWLDAVPETVYGRGRLAFYGKANAIARGDEALTKYDRYTGADTKNDPFAFDLLGSERTKALYYDAEAESGYIRDRNVFRDGIDIYDTMSLLVGYRTGVNLNYSLNAFCPVEGYRAFITGDKGRIEYSELHASHIIAGQSDKELASQQNQVNEHEKHKLLYYPLFGEGQRIEIQAAEGGHGGGDPLIQEQIFASNPPADPYGRSAGHEQGVASAIIGIAGNRSIESGKVIDLNDLVSLKPGTKKLSELI